ncbi:MAG: FAD-dependent oxidoreductase [Coxiellaceae bacterium]|nr:FAD-dependent oxidoreductase [Coxiellaceae bacterium]
MSDLPVVIIGSGLAGYMTAKEFRKRDQQTKLIIITEQDGRFYSKPQLSTALAHKKTADEVAMGSAEKMAEQLNAYVLNDAVVESIDTEQQQVVLASKEVIPYRDLVLATGADVLHAPIAGDAIDQVLSINNLQDYARFREAITDAKHIAIMGAGLVGCEYAHDLLQAGYQVSLIAPDKWPLQRFVPQAIGELMRDKLTEGGAQWYLEQFATDINQCDDRQLRLTLCDQRGEVDADVVLSAIGFRPSETVARTAGVKCDHGILVDKQFRTSQAHIYALGDCSRVDGLWQPFVAPISHGCKVLAENLCGGQAEIVYPVMPVVTKTPLCPLVMVLPPTDVEGEWQVTGDRPNLTARFIDQQSNLRGFALTGDTIKQRMEWVKQLQAQ